MIEDSPLSGEGFRLVLIYLVGLAASRMLKGGIADFEVGLRF